MRTSIFLFLCLFSTSASFAQSQSSMGASGGCQDGKNAAYSKSSSAYSSIMNNSAISLEYKSAYSNAFFDCRDRELASSKTSWKFSKGSSVYGQRQSLSDPEAIRKRLKNDEADRGDNEKKPKQFWEMFYKSNREK
ncbi:MAG: hypothetical protein AAFU74_13900 [Bacteroidota bacterium]